MFERNSFFGGGGGQVFSIHIQPLQQGPHSRVGNSAQESHHSVPRNSQYSFPLADGPRREQGALRRPVRTDDASVRKRPHQLFRSVRWAREAGSLSRQTVRAHSTYQRQNHPHIFWGHPVDFFGTCVRKRRRQKRKNYGFKADAQRNPAEGRWMLKEIEDPKLCNSSNSGFCP